MASMMTAINDSTGVVNNLKVNSAGELLVSTSGASVSTTATVTSVSSSASSVQLLASTSTREMASFYNNSTAVLYLKMGTTASATDFTVEIPSETLYELPFPCYTGRIDGIWASANGACLVTEQA